MWINFFVTSIRNISRNKIFSFLNIGGLALGLSALIITLLFINNETSFDHFFKNGNRIYRLNEIHHFKGSAEEKVSLSMYPMASALQKDYPEIESTVRISDNDDITLKVGDKQLLSKDVINADSTFFRIFDFAALKGNKNTALDEPGNIVITETIAQNLFGKTDVAGQTIQVNRYGQFENFTVSAVIKTLPDNSHLQFEAILPLHSIRMRDWMKSWDANWVNTYLLIKENGTVNHLVHSLPEFEKRYLAEQASDYKLYLQPLYAIHLDSGDISHDRNYKKFSRIYIYVFQSIALFVLLIAMLNFINLSTARATKRAKEVGIRKTIGSTRWQLIKLFIGEAIIFSLLAMGLAMIITVIGAPRLSALIHRSIPLFTPHSFYLWYLFIAMAIGIGILAGIYPALFLSSYKPMRVLKGIGTLSNNRNVSLRNVFVVVQFTIAATLIVSTIIMVQQMNFIKNKDVGFDKEQVVVIPMNASANKNYEPLKNELKKSSDITNITAFNIILGNEFGSMGSRYKTEKGETKDLSISHLVVDQNYLDFFKIKIIAGRNFSHEFSDTAGHSYIINETLAKQLETKNAVGTPFAANWIKEMGSVIGVTSDFNFNSLHDKIAPLYISMQNWDYRYMAVKLKPGSNDKGLATIEQTWKKYVSDMPLSYSFLDEHLNTIYQSDRQLSRLVSLLTGLAILIACLGLFGVALYTTEMRKLEIGIRKVMGASVANISALLSKQFLKPVALALLIAFPIAWFCINKWLQDFAYHIKINVWIFIVASLVAIITAYVTIIFQVLKAATANPVTNLRSE